MGNQNSGSVAVSHPPSNWTQSFPREHKKLKKYGALAENKVLPQRIPGQRLRPTENGHVLQTKGTITAKRTTDFHAPHHPVFPSPLNLQAASQLHHPLQPPHSASMSALHHPHLNNDHACLIHDIRFGRPPSKTYASEPDLRGPTPSTPVSVPQTHTIISESPTKGRIKSKKKYKAPPVPQNGINESYPTPKEEHSYSVGDDAMQSPQGYISQEYGVHWAGQLISQHCTSPNDQKPKPRKGGLFRKKNETRCTSADEHYSSSNEPDRVRALSEERHAAASPIQKSPRDELRERARSLDCLQHELRHSPVSHSAPMAATSLTHLHHVHEPRLWTTLERDSRHSLQQELDSRRSSTIERESRRSSGGERESKRSITFDREQHRSHRRMSTLERKLEERKQWANDGRDHGQSYNRHLSRLDFYRDSSHHRSSSTGSHHELIPEESGKFDIRDEWNGTQADMVPGKKEKEHRVIDDWDKAEAEMNQRKKMSASLQAELLSTVKNLKNPPEQEQLSSTLTSKSKEHGKDSFVSCQQPSSNQMTDTQNETQPKTFFFGMEPQIPKSNRSETNTGLHKIKNQEEVAKINHQEAVHISGQSVEYTRRTLERVDKHQSMQKDAKKIKSSQLQISDESENPKTQIHNNRRKLSKDVEEFAVAIERHKVNLVDGESGASGSSRREDGGYHSRQNSGSLYLDTEQVGGDGELSLNLRPTLPRRQLEIPRFSPNAAWRSLSLERANRNTNVLDESRSSEEPEPMNETRIQHLTRPTAPPRGTGEKSADSGISGDAGSPGPGHEFDPLTSQEKTKSNSGPLAVSSPLTMGRQEVRRAWTPAQDLDDNSLDGSGEQPIISEGLSTPPKLTSRSNMFGKSQELATEQDTDVDFTNETEPVSELISSDKKDPWGRRIKRNGVDVFPNKFNSLRKLKRSVSGAITVLGRKSPATEECLQGRTTEDSQIFQHVDDSNWRDNWSMSRSIPNSLNTCEEHDTESNLSSSRNFRSRSESRLIAGGGCGETVEESRSRTPTYLQYGNTGHIMYLPEYNSRRKPSEDGSDKRFLHTTAQREFDHEQQRDLHHAVRPLTPENERKPPSGDEDPSQPENFHSPDSLPNNFVSQPPSFFKKGKGKKFSYQSTVRILEKKKLEEKLAREVAEKERLRIKEIEAMKKVEEEFQKKREREKKKLKQQLKLYNMHNQQQQNHLSSRDYLNHSYSSDEQVPSSYSIERHEISSQDSFYNTPSLPRAPPPQIYPAAFSSLPSEFQTEASPGILSGLKSWVRGRKESRSSSTSTLTSAPRQEPDGAPASSPRKSSDDNNSASSLQKTSDENSDQIKPDFRAEIIAASKKRNGKAQNYREIAHSQCCLSQNHRQNASCQGDDIEIFAPQSGHSQNLSEDTKYFATHDQRTSKSRSREDHHLPASPDSKRLSQGMMQELPEFHQQRREYREYRSPSRQSQSPSTRKASSPPSSIAPAKISNYRRDFCHGTRAMTGAH
ncbi:SAFB-like transcription modulator isoform X2 [Macrobrachium rosenbergii]|uniref:SAFB-like transcription modulator isoform X2 n=1 Tax=Macrobrachium rosenbergii TaxID=79674 RepID=UPI0034D52F91